MWPKRAIYPLVRITPFSMESLGEHLNGVGSEMNAAASATWPQANLAMYFPFVLTRTVRAVKLFWYNGASVSGNRDVGIYDARGRKLISTGSVAGGATNQFQELDITDTLVGPGLFYLAMASANTTGAYFRVAPTLSRAMGCLQQASALPLPATATFAVGANVYIPIMGFSTRPVI